jgi:hypothetical protein
MSQPGILTRLFLDVVLLTRCIIGYIHYFIHTHVIQTGILYCCFIQAR